MGNAVFSYELPLFFFFFVFLSTIKEKFIHDKKNCPNATMMRLFGPISQFIDRFTTIQKVYILHCFCKNINILDQIQYLTRNLNVSLNGLNRILRISFNNNIRRPLLDNRQTASLIARVSLLKLDNHKLSFY